MTCKHNSIQINDQLKVKEINYYVAYFLNNFCVKYDQFHIKAK